MKYDTTLKFDMTAKIDPSLFLDESGIVNPLIYASYVDVERYGKNALEASEKIKKQGVLISDLKKEHQDKLFNELRNNPDRYCKGEPVCASVKALLAPIELPIEITMNNEKNLDVNPLKINELTDSDLRSVLDCREDFDVTLIKDLKKIYSLEITDFDRDYHDRHHYFGDITINNNRFEFDYYKNLSQIDFIDESNRSVYSYYVVPELFNSNEQLCEIQDVILDEITKYKNAQLDR